MNPLPYKRRPATSQLLFPADGLEGVQHRLVELLHGRRLLQLPHLRLPQLEHPGGVADLQSGSPYSLFSFQPGTPDPPKAHLQELLGRRRGGRVCRRGWGLVQKERLK